IHPQPMSSCCCWSLAAGAAILLALVAALLHVARKRGFFSLLVYSVDKDSTRCGGDLVAEVLKSHGVKFVFTLCGGHVSPILVACERLGLRVVDTRHEVTTVFAADAVARISGGLAAACVTAGPGLTNTVTAVKNAQMAESPLLLLGGAAAGILKGRGALQDIDQLALLKPLCKFNATVTAVRDIVPTLRRAIQAAHSGTPGPVFVELPIDTLYPIGLVAREIGVKEAPGLSARIVKFIVDAYIHNLFGDAFRKRDVSPLPPVVPMPSNAQVDRLADMIRQAKRPVVVLGSQAVLPPVPADRTRASLEAMGLPCFLGGMSRGLLGQDSEIQLRHCRRDALREADFVLLAGTVCDFRLNYGRSLSRRSRIAAVNRSEAQLRRNSDLFWTPALAVVADVGTTLERVAQRLAGHRPPEDWLASLRTLDSDKSRSNSAKAAEPLAASGKLNPLHVLTKLEAAMSDRTVLVADGGDFVGSAAYLLRPRGPLRWLDPGAFGTLGVGAGFALGAKLCLPDHDIVVVWGDGSLGYSLVEFDTFKRHELPVLGIVGNDACWTQIAREQIPLFGSSVGCELSYSRYDQAMSAFDCRGILVDKPDAGRLSEVFAEALQATRGGTPCLVNCLIGKTDFREGSVSV
uniref:2-hydroxyacyl-CoA lyase 2 n=2 Tax=Macrostomum lignano TaxID=282301 RepID=A0A1I8H1T3_9PLAT